MENNIDKKFISIDNLALFAELLKTTYATKDYVDKGGSNSTPQVQMFIGTKDEYTSAKRAGTICAGSLVLILTDDEANKLGNQENGNTATAVLGKAILGVLKLNNM